MNDSNMVTDDEFTDEIALAIFLVALEVDKEKLIEILKSIK